MFEMKKLCVSYGKKEVLRDVSLSLQSGTITALLGANGCGKTTLLKAIGDLLPHEGQCELDGTPLENLSARQMARHVSYIPQRSGIAIDLTAQEVVLMGFNAQLGLLRQPTKQMNEQAVAVLAQLGVDAKQNYQTLSEGQKQLCILGRTMVTQGKLLLLDEPESALDLKNRYEIFVKLRRWMEDRMVLAAIHDPQLALQMADQLILLKDGGVFAVLRPKTDSLSNMEAALCAIYGSVKLYRLDNTIAMIKTGDEL